VWPAGGRTDLAALKDTKDALKQADHEEYHRLLYVAMTRARDRLYVCGWKGQKEKPETASWHELVEEGLTGQLTEIVGPDGTVVRRMQSVQAKQVDDFEEEKARRPKAAFPDWALTPAKPERSRPKLAPSRLALGLEGGEHRAEGEQPPLGPRSLSEGSRYARGRLVHALLQHLPEVGPNDQEKAARAFVAARGSSLPQELKDEIVAESLAIVGNPRFAPLFQPRSLAEVPVVASIGEGESAFDLEGQIDRLAVLTHDLLILDYKTNRPPPATPEEVAPAYIAQLAAYRLALKDLFPGRSLRAALLWTDGPRLMEIPSTSLDAAEDRLRQRRREP
jgi:ATP-dependent helicase/nuclease subunit A